jgi:hypothetical protein
MRSSRAPMGALFPGFRRREASRSTSARLWQRGHDALQAFNDAVLGLDIQDQRIAVAGSSGAHGLTPMPFRLAVINEPGGAVVLHVAHGGALIALPLTEIERATLLEALQQRSA